MDTERDKDYSINFSKHADCGTYTTDFHIETNNEQIYNKNMRLLTNLLNDINNSEISPDLKRRIVDGIKAASENSFATALIIELIKKYFG